MEVKTLSVTSPRIFEKQQEYQPIFKDGLATFFAPRKYGDTVNEILYTEILMPDEFDEPYDGETVKYIPEEKKIICIVQPVYKKAVNASLSKYGKLLASEYLNITNLFIELNVDDFDLQKFRSDLLEFFKDNKLV